MDNSDDKNVEYLDMVDRKNLLNRLINGVSPELLEEEYCVNIPNVVTAYYSCPHCQKDFPIKLITQDISRNTRFVRCPNCRTKSFITTLQKSTNVVTRKRATIDDFFTNE